MTPTSMNQYTPRTNLLMAHGERSIGQANQYNQISVLPKTSEGMAQAYANIPVHVLAQDAIKAQKSGNGIVPPVAPTL